MTVNGVGYAQVDRFDSTTPAQSFLAGTNASGQTTITFPAPLPAGTGNVSASYRAGDGSQGNVQAGQITQLLSRPASLSSVTNPLPATGGSGGGDQESVRAAAPVSLSGLGRVVTVTDYVSLASSIAGVAKASAATELRRGCRRHRRRDRSGAAEPRRQPVLGRRRGHRRGGRPRAAGAGPAGQPVPDRADRGR